MMTRTPTPRSTALNVMARSETTIPSSESSTRKPWRQTRRARAAEDLTSNACARHRTMNTARVLEPKKRTLPVTNHPHLAQRKRCDCRRNTHVHR
eukprot:2277499-Pleurochrysis_carterae.AAC.1